MCASADEADRVLGQLKLAVRRSYSSPPMTGGLLVAEVLGDPALRADWVAEVAVMRHRMAAMRVRLADALATRSGGFDTGFVLEQRGMFSFTGLSPAQVAAMRERDGVYLVDNGRMCVAGLSDGNVDHVARSLMRAVQTS